MLGLVEEVTLKMFQLSLKMEKIGNVFITPVTSMHQAPQTGLFGLTKGLVQPAQ